jgi:hypothetical protein
MRASEPLSATNVHLSGQVNAPNWLVHYGYTPAQPDRDWFTIGLDTTQIRPI